MNNDYSSAPRSEQCSNENCGPLQRARRTGAEVSRSGAGRDYRWHIVEAPAYAAHPAMAYTRTTHPTAIAATGEAMTFLRLQKATPTVASVKMTDETTRAPTTATHSNVHVPGIDALPRSMSSSASPQMTLEPVSASTTATPSRRTDAMRSATPDADRPCQPVRR